MRNVRGRHGDFRSPHVGWFQGPRLDEDGCQANVPDRYDVVVEPISDVVDPRGWDRNQFNEFSRENRAWLCDAPTCPRRKTASIDC